MKPLRIFLALIVGALTCSILVSPSSAATPSTTTPPTYHQASNHHTVHLKKGHVLRISLATASDGGYSWAVVQGKHSSKFHIVSRKVVSAPSTGNPPMVGGVTHTVWTIKGTARGIATFKAVERRSFDKSDVIKRFTLHVHVTRH